MAPIAIAAALLVPTAAFAADSGTITGRVVNATTGEPEPGVRITLLGGRGGSALRVVSHSQTDHRGRYSFDDLPTGAERIYALDARFDGGVFSGKPIALPAGTSQRVVVESTLRVWDTISNPGAILISRDDLFVVQGDDGSVSVIESVKVTNPTERAYVGRTASAGRAATLGFSLPGSANGMQIADSDIERSGIRPTEYGFAVTAAIPPGEWNTTFVYDVDGSGGRFDLTRPALYPILEMSVHATEPLEVRSNRLTPAGQVTLEGKSYRRWSTTETIDPADSIQVVAVAEAGLPPAVVIGAVAVAAVIAAGLAVGVRRRGAARARRPVGSPASGLRRGLVAAIAELDLRHDRGEVSDDEWSSRRAELKQKVMGAKIRERAP